MIPIQRVYGLLSALLSALFFIPAEARGQGPPTPADLVLKNGNVWTGEPYLEPRKKNVPAQRASAIAVVGERIVATGSNQEIDRFVGPNTKVMELHGMLVIPGFFDDHVHFLTGGFQLTQVSLRESRSEEELVARVAEKARQLGKGEWIEGGRWNVTRWRSHAMPTRWLIDPMTRENPAFLNSWDGLQILANSLALKLAGITETTPDPPGEHIVRDPVTHQATGILKDAAMDLGARVMPKRTPQQIEEALQRGLQEARRFGVTSVADMNLGEHSPSGGINYARTSVGDEIRLLRRAEEQGWLTCRFYEFIPITDWPWLAQLGITHNTGANFIQLGAVKGFADGSIESSTAWMFTPFADQPGNLGLPNPLLVPQSKTEKMMKDISGAGIQVAVHAIGERAIAEMLDVYARAITDAEKQRFRLEHEEITRRGDIPRFAQIGVIASMQPMIGGGAGVVERVGDERAKSSHAWRSMLEGGATLAFGSDWPVVTLNPLIGIYSAVTRQDLQGNPPSGWMPQERITVEEALRAKTCAFLPRFSAAKLSIGRSEGFS